MDAAASQVRGNRLGRRSDSPASRDWRFAVPAVAVVAWGGNEFTPLLVMYRRLEGYSQVQVDIFLALYIVGLVPALLAVGVLSDRFGRKPLMYAALVCGAVASAVLAAGSASAACICIGRLLSGASVGAAMVTGTTWIEELGAAPHGSARVAGIGARRASVALTAGLGLGAGVAGVLAQWGPEPQVVAYAVHIALCVLSAALLRGVAETRVSGLPARRLRDDLTLPPLARRRFLTVVLPMAPWVFGAASLAYAMTPTLVEHRTGNDAIAFATLLTVVTLGTGVIAQQLVPQVARLTGQRVPLAGMLTCTVGLILCAIEAVARSLLLAVVIAMVLGAGYGLCLVAGLVQVRLAANRTELGALTGAYYGLTYLGFVLPAVLAAISGRASYPTLLTILAALCLGCAAVVHVGHTRANAAQIPVMTTS